MTFAKHVLDYLFQLDFTPELPKNIQVMNPYQDASPEIKKTIQEFYSKFYSDQNKRKLILGINPGRLGAGATGIPFTDSKRMEQHCKITMEGFSTHEPSSVFVYDVINAMGGPKSFYKDFYISSVCPLGFVQLNKKGNWVNFNYYDDSAFFETVEPYIIEQLKLQLAWNINTKNVFCLGTGKNYKALMALNQKHKLFGKITPLEHPRYVMQYKSKQASDYVEKFIRILSEVS